MYSGILSFIPRRLTAIHILWAQLLQIAVRLATVRKPQANELQL